MPVRRIVRIVFRGFGGLIVFVIAAVLVILATGPGHRFLERRLIGVVSNAIDGEIRINSIGGALWRSVEINGLELKTEDGKSAIRAERIVATFALSDLLRGRFILKSVTLVRPLIELDQWPDGRWNVEHLFRLTSKRDTSVHTARPLVLMHDVTITDGMLIVRARAGEHDTVITRVIDSLNTDLSRLRVSHPDSTAIEADARRLGLKIDNPRLALRNADGTLALNGDTLRFDLDHVTLPGTNATFRGQMQWGGPNFVLDAAVNASPLAFDDIRGIVPMVPEDGGGELAMIAKLEEDGTVRLDVRTADIHSGRSVIRGRGDFTILESGNGTVRNVDLALQPFDFALLTPYVDSLPVRGLVRGRIRGDGALKDLVLDANLDWTDEGTAGSPVNTIDARGRMIFGGRHGVNFRSVTLRRADMDMGSIHAFAPSVNLAGRMRVRGTLEGPWRAAQFNGVIDHYADGLGSTIHGAVKLGIGDASAVDAEVVVDSLSLDLLRRTWPAIPVTGSLHGRITMHGPLDSNLIDVALAGTAGRVTAQGLLAVHDSDVTLALAGTFDSLDLEGMRIGNPPSQLVGTWRADLVLPTDSTRVATGSARLDLSGVTMGGLALGPGAVDVRLDPDAIHLDTLRLDFNGGGLQASGSIGRGATSGKIDFAAHADTIGYLEPLVRFFATAPGDSGVVKLDGRGALNGSIEGSTEAFTLVADASVDGVHVKTNSTRGLRVHAQINRGPQGMTIAAKATADTMRLGNLGYKPVELELGGRLDSLVVTANVGFLKTSSLRARFASRSDSTTRTIVLDSMELTLPVHTWRLEKPVTARLTAGSLVIDTLDFRAEPGAGFILAAGTLRRSGLTSFVLNADSIPLEDLYAAAQEDTTNVKGAFSAGATIEGPAEAPVIELSAQLAQGRMGDYNLPLIEVQGAYRDRHLTITGALSRDSVRIVTINGSLPIDLSLQSVAKRELDGPIEIVAHADTLDMRVLNAITSTVSGVSGLMALDLRAGGTWSAPALSGYIDISNGTVQVPAIGADYSGMDLRLEGPGDSTLRVVRGRLQGGSGTLEISGQVNFKELAHPELDMRLNATRFAAFNIRGFGSLTATTSAPLTLTGPLIGATMRGRIVADEGSLQFANLVEKRIVSLDDPEFRAMVDSNLAGADLAPAGHQIFFDSLRIDNLSLEMGPDVWLRSSDANIQLAGEIQVQRRFESNLARYRIDGTLRAVRGNYKLAIGLVNSPIAVTRDFRVTRGTVRFFGTPDLNPEMDVAAEYVTRTVQRQPLTVRAIIEGTLLYPRLRLETDSPLPLTETEIASYLMFGQPSPNLGGAGLTNQAVVVAGGALGGVGQALASELGLPINYLTITPGTGNPTSSTGIASSRIEAGAQLNEKTFLTLTAGLCEVRALGYKGVGAALERRLSNVWSVNIAFEPVIVECGVSVTATQLASKYQFGLDLFWQSGVR